MLQHVPGFLGMASPKRGKNSLSHKIAVGGIFSAMSMMVLLAGGVIPVGTFAAPMFAGVCLIPVAVSLGPKWALLCYGAVSGLSFLLVRDHELMLFYIFLLGYYPIVQPFINRLKNRVLRDGAKLLVVNGAIALVYLVLLAVLASPLLKAEFSTKAGWFWGVLVVIGNITFFIYDVMVDRLRYIYQVKYHKRLFR